MSKPTIKELVQQFKPVDPEKFADEIIEYWPIYGNMRSILIDMIRKEMKQALSAKER